MRMELESMDGRRLFRELIGGDLVSLSCDSAFDAEMEEEKGYWVR